jgi:FkbM family methyltransferase
MLRRAIALLDSLGLRKHPQLRLFLKHSYCKMVDPFDRGRDVPLKIGISLHAPTFFATDAWSNYESDAMRACHNWLQLHPDAVLADVGCSIAIYSLMALQATKRVRVLAFDSDTISLKKSAEFCRFADSSRLGLVHGFLTDRGDPESTLAEALAATGMVHASADIKGEPTASRFLCLDRPMPDEAIPRYSIDGLLLSALPLGTPLLVKIDVEGAELLVLRGASKLMLLQRPTLMLSVHPQFLPSFQQDVGDIAAFLRGHGYHWKVLAIDHEEHWWCEPMAIAAKAL